jgi:hypothetical protein
MEVGGNLQESMKEFSRRLKIYRKPWRCKTCFTTSYLHFFFELKPWETIRRL